MAMVNRLRWRVLGPFEVLVGERPVDVGAGKQRALLALLVVRRGHAVPIEEAIEELWPHGPPPTAHKTVQVYVSRLRKALGPEVIATEAAGYRIDIDDASLDAAAFEAATAAARAQLAGGDARAAKRELDEALGLWRGLPLGEVDAEFAAREATRLEELRLDAQEDRFDAELALGHHRAIVSDLKRLIAAEPLRERPRAQLMLALYRCGRQADALAVYRETRRTLLDEVGLEPGPGLRELERRILEQDASLREGNDPLPRMPTRRRRRTVAAVSVAIAVAAAVIGGAVLSGGATPPPRAAPTHALTVIDRAGKRVVARVPVAADPVGVTVGDDGVWVASARDQVLQKIDPARRSIVRTIGLGATPSAVASGAGVVWVANGAEGTVARVEAATATVTDTVPVRPKLTSDFFARSTPSAVAVGTRTLWVNRDLAALVRVDAAGGRRRTVSLGAGRSSDALALGFGALWVTSGEDGRLYRADPARLNPTGSVKLPGTGRAVLAVGAEGVWVGSRESGRLLRVDPRTLRTRPAGTVEGPLVALAVGAGAVWALSGPAATVSRIDPRTGRVADRLVVGGRPTALAAGVDAVWVTTTGSREAVPPAGPVRPVRAGSCEAIHYGGVGAPSRLIVVDVPTHWADSPGVALGIRRDIAAAKDVLRRRGFQAGRFTVGLQVCSDSTERAGYWTDQRCVANARAYAETPALAGIIGPVHSGCARLQLPVLAEAPGGPPAQVGFPTTYLGLTRSGPGTAPGEPASPGSAATRGFVRPVGPDDAQGVALAQLARQSGAHRVFILDDATSHGLPVSRAAKAALEVQGIELEGAIWNERHRSYRPLAQRIRRFAPDAVILAGCVCANGGKLARDLRAALDPRTRLLASDVWGGIEYLREVAGPAAIGVHLMAGGPVPQHLGPPARALVQRIGPLPSPEDGNPGEVLLAAQAAEVLVQAIARSDGSRGSVRRELDRGRFETVAGPVSFDASGDATAPRFTAYRVGPQSVTAIPINVDPNLLTRVRRDIGSL